MYISFQFHFSSKISFYIRNVLVQVVQVHFHNVSQQEHNYNQCACTWLASYVYPCFLAKSAARETHWENATTLMMMASVR